MHFESVTASNGASLHLLLDVTDLTVWLVLAIELLPVGC
jgi:hypothetical protein